MVRDIEKLSLQPAYESTLQLFLSYLPIHDIVFVGIWFKFSCFPLMQITPTMENPHVLEDIETIVREEGIIERTQK